jgi:hypothetical protein
MSNRARDLFEARTEYRLPKKAKTKDYIFHFVPAGDPYGGAARKFLSKFYKSHVAKDVSSIEELIGYLDDQVSGGVEHIREVVIVAHANPRGMVLKLVENASATTNAEYRYVTFESLAILQKDFADGKFATFKKNRARVIAHLTDTSWVTVRGCRLGSGPEVMYALYAFFGGRANVWAPRYYQFFGWQRVTKGKRFDSRLDAHAHLVKQRFFPKDLHTDERKDAVVQFLSDPGLYSETVELDASANPTSDEPYMKLIRDLDAGRIPAAVKSKLAEHEHVLSERARVEAIREHGVWKIHDKVKHASVTYAIEYEIWEEVSGGRGVLKAAAQLIQPSTGEVMPFQSFYYESENDLFRGKLFTLAGYVENAQANPPFDPAEKAAFEAAITALDGGRLVAGSTDLVALFKAEGLEVTEAATVTHGTAAAGKGPWTVTEGADAYLVKRESSVDGDGGEGHGLSVFKHLTGAAKRAEQDEIMTWLGNDPDTPGPELAAYLDTIATEDLMAIIDHLRDPYREEHSFYIFHVLHALQRKRDYHTWWAQQMEAMPKNEPLPEAPYLELSRLEYADKDALVYSFRFNEHWAEVKTSFPKLPAFTGDLFAIEHDLWKKFRSGDLDRNAPIVEADSPAADIEEARRLERQNNEKYMKDVKASFEPPPASTQVTCEEFRALIEKLKTLDGLSLDEIEKQLALEMGPTNKSLWQTFKDLKDLYKVFNMLRTAAALDATALNGLDMISKSLKVRIAEKIPWIAPSAVGTPSVAGIALRVFGLVSLTLIPLTVMWKNFLDEQMRAVAMWKNAGKIAGVRRYLNELWSWTRSANYPDNLVIQIDPNDYENIYFAERDRFIGGPPNHRILFFGEDVKEGLIEGLKLMEEVGPAIVDAAHGAIADVLAGMQFDACMTQVLVDAKLLDLDDLRAQAIRALVSRALDEVPGL